MRLAARAFRVRSASSPAGKTVDRMRQVAVLAIPLHVALVKAHGVPAGMQRCHQMAPLIDCDSRWTLPSPAATGMTRWPVEVRVGSQSVGWGRV